MSAGKKPVNLMFYIASLYHGGAERVVANLCRYLDAEKYSITVCWRTANGAVAEELIEQGFKVVGLPDIDPGISPYRRFLSLRRLLHDLQIDLIHTHDTGSLADAAQCRLLGSRARIVHTFHFGNYPNRKRSYLWMERVFCRLADCCVAVGSEQAKSIQMALKLKKSRLSVIQNGVEKIAACSQTGRRLEIPGVSSDDIVIGSLSTLTVQKGLFVLLDAVEILRDRGLRCKVVIAGGGPLESELERVVRERRLESIVSFLGWVGDAGNVFLPSLDIFCQSSLWEANSIVLLEAMAAGLPIVTTNVGESMHVIDHERNGLIVEPGNAPVLAEALARLINDATERNQMGDRARVHFEEKFTVQRMVRNYESVYEIATAH